MYNWPNCTGIQVLFCMMSSHYGQFKSIMMMITLPKAHRWFIQYAQCHVQLKAPPPKKTNLTSLKGDETLSHCNNKVRMTFINPAGDVCILRYAFWHMYILWETVVFVICPSVYSKRQQQKIVWLECAENSSIWTEHLLIFWQKQTKQTNKKLKSL